jgi:phytoene dehydrogenase-like protein
MGKKVIIIGGGVAGLSSGIYGQMNGYDTEIIEMHTMPGGQCTAWDRKGYRFDYCLHWLVGTAKGSFHNIWKETNVINDQTKIIDHDIFTKVTNDRGEELIIYTNIDRWKKYLIDLAPEDKASIKKMCRHMRKMSLLEPLDDKKGIKTIVALFKMAPILPLFIKYSKKNCSDYFKELNFKSERLSLFFNKLYGERNFSAIAFIAMLGWFNQRNAGYIIGGSLPIAKRMAEKYQSLGGKLTLGKRVSKILIENDEATGVLLSDGSVLKGDYIISAADGHSTIFEMLDGKYISKQLKEAYENWDLFVPLVQVSFGVDTRIKTDDPIHSFITENKKIGSTSLNMGYSIMTYFFDPTMAPEGKTTVVMRFESSWDIWKDMTVEAYKMEKETIKTDATALLESHFPGITGMIEVTDVATPLTDVRYTGVWKGSYEGFAPASNNITKTLKNTLPDLQNFYLAGQWLQPGGGLPPSVMSGKMAISKICKNDKKEFIVTK